MSGRIREAALELARQKMVQTNQWNSAQSMGRRWPIGCVALEITQRCNLDCTACYLSEASESVRDLPLEEVYRRVDAIRRVYGAGIDVQVTGGDPTLRKREELLSIVRYVRDSGLRPTLMTNGIRTTRELFIALVDAGLVDVAFHVDLTQGRRGFKSERDLHEVRSCYIEQVRSLPLSVFFNTTVFDGNFHDIPDLVAFFVRQSDVVRLASFQPQAVTGRGSLAEHSKLIDMRSVIQQIEKGAGTSLSFDTAQAGHRLCNRYAMTLVANGHAYDVLDNPELYNLALDRSAADEFDRQSVRRTIRTILRRVRTNPEIVAAGWRWMAAKVWEMRRDLVASRGRVNKLSFFVHDFMSACDLDPERIDACIFMAVTHDGPVSMCLHNAQRDDFILRPIRHPREDSDLWWDPLSGQTANSPDRFAAGKAAPSTNRFRGRAGDGCR